MQHVETKGLCIGSGYIYDIIVIDALRRMSGRE